MDAVLERALASLPNRASLLDEFLHVYGAMISFHEHDPELARAFVKEMLFVSPPNRANVLEFIDGLDAKLAARIALLQRQGALDPAVPALLVAENCFALYIVHLQQWLAAEERPAVTTLLARLSEVLALQLRALEPRAAREVRGCRAPKRRRA